MRIIKAYEVLVEDENDQVYKLILKDSLREKPDTKATLSKNLSISFNDQNNQAISIVGMIPGEIANEYNSPVQAEGLPSKEIKREGDILDDSSDGPGTYLESVWDKRQNIVQPLKTGDLLLVEIDKVTQTFSDESS